MATRVAPIAPGSRPELFPIESRIVAERGHVMLLYQVLLNSAPLADGWREFLTAIRSKTSVPPAIRELAILRVAILNRAPYEFAAHAPHAKAAGLSDAKLEALRSAEPAVEFTELERAVLALTDAMTRDVQVPDAMFDPLRSHFDDRGLVELVATISAYNMVSRFLEALKIGH